MAAARVSECRRGGLFAVDSPDESPRTLEYGENVLCTMMYRILKPIHYLPLDIPTDGAV